VHQLAGYIYAQQPLVTPAIVAAKE
jgi:hypothetical protein